MRKPFLMLILSVLFAWSGVRAAEPAVKENPPSAPTSAKPDLAREKTLYVVGYAHLDTQWRWDYATTIDTFIRNTLEHNFQRFEQYPGYAFTFTGAVRYGMMKEYYPELYSRLKELVRQGRWHVGGSSVDEGDVNVPAPESVIRQILYGNKYFRREFGRESVDYMLPDCFGFPASLPSIFAHCGLKGFSTQKLTWGSAVGIPFNVGVWEGPDGKGVVCAFNPGDYTGRLKQRLDIDPDWVKRLEENGKQYGILADYHYYGVGDQGGAPREEDVRILQASLDQPDALIRVIAASSDQFYRDLTPEQIRALPRYRGDLLLTEHSAGSITSQAYMKRWNRKNEQLADAAERAAVTADWLGGQPYPAARLEEGWQRVLASQFHDILPGTSLPRCYEYSWNDEVLALNRFAAVLESSAGAITRSLDTRGPGQALAVYNPLSREREDLVEAEVLFPAAASGAVQVTDPDGRAVPSQILSRQENSLTVLFPARVPANGWAVYHVQAEKSPPAAATALQIQGRVLENGRYRVMVDENGDVSSIRDKAAGNRELLAAPARLQFLAERPQHWPAWNMDWADRQQPPAGYVDGPARFRIAESGPVRVALEIQRQCRDSIFTQQIRLSAGEAGNRLEFATHIDWQTSGYSLKAAFPLTVDNPEATYSWGLGTIRRGDNDSKKYEVPSHEWFDLTDAGGDYGVSVLEDCKFGSDKPGGRNLRLTLLYTPGVREHYLEQSSQDWGRHDLIYALYGHRGDWRQGESEWQGRKLNQPLAAFQVPAHAGAAGKRFSLFQVSTGQVDVRAVKKAEDGTGYIVRLQELHGKPAPGVTLRFAAPVRQAREVDGQERNIGPVVIEEGKLVVNFEPSGIKSYHVRLAETAFRVPPAVQQPLPLAFDSDIASQDGESGGGEMADGLAFPGHMLPVRLETEAAAFTLGSTKPGDKNALTCRGQVLELPPGGSGRVFLLAAATGDTTATFQAGNRPVSVEVPGWTGFIGQFDNRVWAGPFPEIDYKGDVALTGMAPGYIKRTPVAWFATHRHGPAGTNQAYRFSYLYRLEIPIPPGARTLTLPRDGSLRLLAATAVRGGGDALRPARPLYDDFTGRPPLPLRGTPARPSMASGAR